MLVHGKKFRGTAPNHATGPPNPQGERIIILQGGAEYLTRS